MGYSEKSWTADIPLPGGDIEAGNFDLFVAQLQEDFAWLPAETLWRLARAYGTRAIALLGDAQGTNDLGENLGGDLYARELDYLASEEFAQIADDVLWRRSKLGLHLTEAERARVADWFAQRAAS